ncbi:hypothetical protein [Antrihabitans stalactiti]|uniref:Uncharacterized protein n=1 Tax=Antrihabitans stalactiti TaxID=2584121 RepID=A0A848KR82_9NOCA|nr:hypothetical protein [Antrihabitans stalactiti]NMN99082.1 hypothetical protein [Antrihabitans stalactiti]
MGVVADIEHTISNLTLDGLPNVTVGTYTATQILDAHTLAIVVLAHRYSDLIEQTIKDQTLGTTEITALRDVITVRI